MRIALAVIVPAGLIAAPLVFRSQEISKEPGVIYAVSIADVNGDKRPDIVIINPTQLVWFENPSWKRHVVLDGGTKKDNVALAPNDIDGDGKLDFAIGADWQPTNTQSGGSLGWVSHAGKLTPLGEEPTLHRIRWGDVDGDGRKELIVMPLHGRDNKGPAWEGRGLRTLVYRVPKDPAGESWQSEVADDLLHIAHNFIVTNFDSDSADEIITASREGVHVLDRSAKGEWTRRRIGDGAPGEIKLGHVARQRHLATVEPWHGHSLVMFAEPLQPLRPDEGPVPLKATGAMWTRSVIEDKLAQAHALGWGDFDSDGSDELAAGWRNKPSGVGVWKRDPRGAWQKQVIDDGGMATEDLAVEDLNADGRPEIVAVGRATLNVKIYWNETQPQWPRHVVATGYFNFTAIGADFTGDGRVDVISNDLRGKRTYLHPAPDWKPVEIHNGLDVIHTVVLDVDGDGDTDLVGARYSPAVLFWLERPSNPLRGPWPFHLIDDATKGGVDGIHGLILGDVDRDGRPDVIANSAQPKGAFPNSIAWFRLLPGGKFARNIFAAGDAPGLSHYMGFGDVNGDGRPDIASAAKIAEGGNWFAWWEQPASGRTPWLRHVIAEKQEGATNIHMGDFNGDGKTDFIASRGHGFGVVWYEAPNWTPHEINSALAGPHSLAVVDLDGDGDLDAATCAKDSRIAAWFENDGRGNFTTHHIYEDQAAYDIRLVDMDNDGDLDVLIAGQASENVVWYENRLRAR